MLTKPLPAHVVRRMIRDATRQNEVKMAEGCLRDWANINGYSSGLLRGEARHLLEERELFLLDPRLREKLVAIANGEY